LGLFDLFKKGLQKTREKLAAGLRSILRIGRKIDDALLDELSDAMIVADMGPATVAKLIDAVKAAWKGGKIREAQDILPFLKEQIAGAFEAMPRELRRAASGPTIVMIVGINGSGKTTTVAKLANHLKKQHNKVLIGACDTFRAAAIEQLGVWAGRLGVDLVKHQAGSDPAAVAFDACDAGLARGVDYILLDTAGRLHTQDHLMAELGKVRRVIQKRVPEGPHEVLLVLDATIGQNAVQQARVFTKVVEVSGLILAKLDGSAKGGIVVGIRDELNLPVKFVGLGETYEDFEPFDPRSFVDALFSEM
jgi:fused signal recognition particle receptor